MSIEGIDILVTLMVAVFGLIFTIYKYLENEFEKKVDKIIYEKEVEFLKTQIKTNSSNIYFLLEKLKEDMRIIRGYIEGENESKNLP